jgi:hypothetical protein
MNLDDGDRLVDVARVVKEDDTGVIEDDGTVPVGAEDEEPEQGELDIESDDEI